MTKLEIIVGSTREGRAADRVGPWVADRARKHGAFDVEVLDLREWPLPMFQETMATVGNFASPTYSQPIVKKWNQKVAEAEAVLFITPEYNHSIPAVLKNAIDSVFVSFALRGKPAAFVGYSNGSVGGARAVEHLMQIAFEAEMVPLRDTVLLAQVSQAFDPSGSPVNPVSEASLKITLDDLAWWAKVLTPARAAGMLPPGNRRLRAAMAPKA
jgi:NAD(P)H-dependent FMN reductase